MQFATKAHIENLQKDATKLGQSLRAGNVDAVCQAIQLHDYFVISAAGGQMVAEAVTATEDGDFICVMVNTADKSPVSYSRENFNTFHDADSDLSVICETLEIVRKTYLAGSGHPTFKVAA